MLSRVRWDEVHTEEAEGGANEAKEEGGEEDDDDDDDEDEDEDGSGGGKATKALSSASENRCDLLWQGTVAKRVFTGLKFQECRGKAAARQLLEEKQLGHFWDLHSASSTTSVDL
jgi:hypothetical protein